MLNLGARKVTVLCFTVCFIASLIIGFFAWNTLVRLIAITPDKAFFAVFGENPTTGCQPFRGGYSGFIKSNRFMVEFEVEPKTFDNLIHKYHLLYDVDIDEKDNFLNEVKSILDVSIDSELGHGVVYLHKSTTADDDSHRDGVILAVDTNRKKVIAMGWSEQLY